MKPQTPMMEILAASALALIMAASGYATTRIQATFDPDAAMRAFSDRAESYAAPPIWGESNGSERRQVA